MEFRIIKPVTKTGNKNGEKEFFDPTAGKPNSNNPYAKMVCICGYELIKESEDTYRCTGGNHRYNISQGEVILDKFGNLLLKLPESALPKAQEK